MPEREIENTVIWTQSGVNRSGVPFIQLMVNDRVIAQLDPREAREVADALLQTTEAAEQDAFLFDFGKEAMGEQAAGRLLVEFRRYREARGKKGPPSDKRDFMVTLEHQKPPAES